MWSSPTKANTARFKIQKIYRGQTLKLLILYGPHTKLYKYSNGPEKKVPTLALEAKNRKHSLLWAQKSVQIIGPQSFNVLNAK